MDTKNAFDIPFIRLVFRAELTEDARLPETKTAALRGGMGEMLLRQNCISDWKCEACRFSRACVVRHTFYSYMEKKPAYMTGGESVGYLIECYDKRTRFRKGEAFEFTLMLFGESIVFFNIYLQAFCQLGMAGLGKDHARFRICEVRNTRGEAVVRENQVDMRLYHIMTVDRYIAQRRKELSAGRGNWMLTFISPLSMKYRGRYLQEFCGEALVSGAARRVQMLGCYIGTDADAPVFAEYPKIRKQTVSKESIRRYSGTQDSRMLLRGISGQVVFANMPEECIDYLIAGELTHMGKNTSFGFGKYRLDVKRV